jgi:hypothetical protein
MGMAGARTAMRSAAMRAEPCDMVQPTWPVAEVEGEVLESPLTDERQIARCH